MSNVVHRVHSAVLIAALLLGAETPTHGQLDFDVEPILYSQSETSDAVQQLSESVAQGDTKLQWDGKHGWLPAVLKALKVPTNSQNLVFSKTSLQLRNISPRRPRALYFNDDVYVGWVQGGDFLELSAVDSQQGAVFYKVRQDPSSFHVMRDNGECLACHATRRTQGVPGYLVRSAKTKSDGHPEFRLGTTTTNHTTPFKDRFGGWYVTGTHGTMRHLGNYQLESQELEIDRELGANQLTLPAHVRSTDYLSGSSDIVALMVLEHQTQMHNFITLASFSTRRAIHQQRNMNRILERPADFQSESTVRRINGVAEKLVRYLLFCDEHELTAEVRGTTSFAIDFAARGRRDNSGRSLRDFDLKTRMFRYPCSYLIYSDSFRKLPELILRRIKQRFEEVLVDGDSSPKFAHLSVEDRTNIHEILVDTHWMFRNTEN